MQFHLANPPLAAGPAVRPDTSKGLRTTPSGEAAEGPAASADHWMELVAALVQPATHRCRRSLYPDLAPDLVGALEALRKIRQTCNACRSHELTADVAAAMSSSGLHALAQVMNGDHVGQLITAMAGIADTLIDAGDHACLGREIADAAFNLRSMRVAAAQTLHARGERAPPAQGHDFRLADAGARVQNALRAVFGVEAGTQGNINVKAGVAPEKTRLAMQKNLQKISTHSSALDALEGDPAQDNSWHAARQAISVATQAQRLALSRVGNASAMAKILALKPNDNPICLPDGATGQLRGGVATASFELRPDSLGNLLLDCAHHINNAASCGPLGMIQLRHGLGHAHYAFTIEISPEGEMSVAGPVRFRYDAQPQNATRCYPVPETLHDILGHGASSAMRADYQHYCKLHHVAKNFEFLKAMEAFNGDPTLEGAHCLHQHFIRDGAQMQVNLPLGQRCDIQHTLVQQRSAEPLSPDEWRALFWPAYSEVWSAMETMTMRACMSFPAWLRRLDSEST